MQGAIGRPATGSSERGADHVADVVAIGCVEVGVDRQRQDALATESSETGSAVPSWCAR